VQVVTAVLVEVLREVAVDRVRGEVLGEAEVEVEVEKVEVEEVASASLMASLMRDTFSS
jgi:hypothetical protein